MTFVGLFYKAANKKFPIVPHAQGANTKVRPVLGWGGIGWRITSKILFYGY
jgi:hypothetical protein